MNKKSRKQISKKKRGGWQPNSKKTSQNKNTRSIHSFKRHTRKISKNSNLLARFLDKSENNK